MKDAMLDALASGLRDDEAAPEPVVRDLRLAAAVHEALTGRPGNARVRRAPEAGAQDEVSPGEPAWSFEDVEGMADKADALALDPEAVANLVARAAMPEDDGLETQGRLAAALGKVSALRPPITTDPMAPMPAGLRDSEKADAQDVAAALVDPLGTLERARREGRLSPVARATIQEFYPGVFESVTTRAAERIASGKVPERLGGRVALADVAGLPTFGGTGEDIAFFQNVYAVGEAADPQGAPPPPKGKSSLSEALKPASAENAL